MAVWEIRDHVDSLPIGREFDSEAEAIRAAERISRRRGDVVQVWMLCPRRGERFVCEC